jgi:hypothetical protein
MESDERDGGQAAPAPAASGALRSADRPLAELEAVIERGRQTFVEVGLALLEIRARRLFRELGFTTFTDYCRQRWDFTPQRAVQLIQAAEVVETVRNLTAVAPAVASHAEALAPLRHEPEAMADAWREAVASAGEPGGGPARVTTALVESAAFGRAVGGPYGAVGGAWIAWFLRSRRADHVCHRTGHRPGAGLRPAAAAGTVDPPCRRRTPAADGAAWPKPPAAAPAAATRVRPSRSSWCGGVRHHRLRATPGVRNIGTEIGGKPAG